MPPAICTLVSGGADIGEAIARDRNIPLVSFTGSTPVRWRCGWGLVVIVVGSFFVVVVIGKRVRHYMR